MTWNAELFNLPEEPEELKKEEVQPQVQETEEQADEPKKRVMFQKAVLPTANSPQIGEYYGKIYNRYTKQYETHLIKVYEPEPNPYDSLKPASVGAQNTGK